MHNDITRSLQIVTDYFKNELIKIEFNDVDHHYSQFTEKELNSIKTKKKAVRFFVSDVPGNQQRKDGTGEFNIQFTAVVICFTLKDRHIECMNSAEYIFKKLAFNDFGDRVIFNPVMPANITIGDLGNSTNEALAMWYVSWTQTIKYKKGEL